MWVIIKQKGIPVYFNHYTVNQFNIERPVWTNVPAVFADKTDADLIKRKFGGTVLYSPKR